MEKIGMVLEGGGLRGIYTAGVLDVFLDNNILVNAVFGVSAGAAHGANYIAKQKGRSLRVNTDYVDDKNYISVYSFLKTGSMVNKEYVYDTIPNTLDPFDYDAFQGSCTRLYVTVSNLETGKAEYINVRELKAGMDYLRASASLPLISKPVEINGCNYLDGGICDSIPITQSIKTGYHKNIVVLTRPEGYIKTESRETKLVNLFYKKYPAFAHQAKNRHISYNKSLEAVAREEEEGNAFVFRPPQTVAVKRLEKDRAVIRSMYALGVKNATERLEDLKVFLNK